MNDQTPTLEAGFVIDPGDSFATLEKLSSLIDQVMPAAVRQAASLEAATKNMVSLGDATAQVTTFGAAATRDLQSAQQSMKRVETSGESMARSLQRSVDTFGLTRAQIRAMDAETKALAAEGKGLDDLAGRLRALSAAMQEQEASTEGVVEAHGHASNSTLLLQHSVRSAADSFAAGLPVSMIFAEQIGRVGEAAALAGGSFGALGAVMAGPWGIAITAGISLAATLLPKLWEGGDAADKETQAFKTLTGATQALNEATGSANKSKQEEIGLSVAATQQKLKEAIAQRTLLAASLESEKATANTPIGGTVAGGVQFAAAAGAQLTASALAANAKQIVDAEKALRGADFVTILNQVKAATDKTAAANQHYEATETSLKRAYEAGGKARGDVAKQLLAATLAQQAATEAGKGAHSQAIEAANDDARISAATTDVARAQAQLTKARHDDAAAVRAGTMTQTAATADIAQHIQAVNAARAAHTAHSAAVRDDAKALRENELAEEALLTSLRTIQQLFDPLTAAASTYSERVDQINKLAAAGKITADQQRDYLLASALAFGEVSRKADEASTSLEGWGVKLDLSKSTDQISKLIDHTALLGDTVNETGASFQDLGAHVTGSMKNVGDLLQVLGKFGDQQAKIDKERKAAGTDQKALDQISAKSLNNQISGTIGLLDAGKQLFASHSAGYKAMQAAEQALMAVQLARAAADAVNTISSIANSGARAAADGTAAVAKTASSVPFPANIAAVAAIVALLAGFGVGLLGGGGGGAVAPPSSADLQKAAGTGTVLGSSNDQSASIAHSLDLVAKNTGDDLGVSGQMLASLKTINTSIVAMAATVGKEISVSGSLGDTSKLNLGSSGSAGFLGMFSSSTTRSLYDAGITLAATTVGNIVANGISGQTYQIVQQVKKSSGFLGIGGGTKTTYNTSTGALPSDISSSIQSVIGALENGIVTAAASIGNDGAKAMLDGFKVDIGKLSFNGLDAQGISDQLNAVFSSVGDKMVEAIMPGIERFQQAGEGLFETLERVASTVVAVDAEMAKLGVSATGVGVDVDMGIASKFDSVSDFTTAADNYFQTFYSNAEQTAAKTAELGKVFDSLGVTMPKTDADFRKLVEAQDLTTSSGQQTYATLLQIAPAFADLQQSMQGAKSAADVLSEQQDLQKQLWQAEGDTASLRAAELATIDPSNRALQQRIYDLQDEQAAEEAASKVAQERAGIQSTLLQLEGDTATIRQQQINALDPSNRALQQQVFALQDQQAAATAAAQAEQQAAQAAAAVAQERAGLETQLLNLQGDTATLRQRELAALDPTNRAIQQQIYDLTDLQAAQQAAAQAAADLAQKEAAFAQERMSLEDQIFQLEGNTAAQRYKALQALDPADRALQQYIYDLQDQQAATAAAAQAAQDAAQAEQAIAQERDGLMQQLYTLTGNTAALRAMQLASLDPSNRALQQQIWAISDAQDAAKAAQDLADAWKSVGDSILDEINRIRGLTDASTGTSTFASLQGQFNAAITAAKGGDQDAAKGLPDLSKSLLDAASSAATSRQELARIEAQTAAALSQVYSLINGGVTTSNMATSSVLGLAANDTGGSSASATDWWDTFAATTAANPSPNSNASELAEIKNELAGMRADLMKGVATVAANTGKLNTNIDNAVRKGGGQSLSVKVAA